MKVIVLLIVSLIISMSVPATALTDLEMILGKETIPEKAKLAIQLAQVRVATAKYHVVEQAIADGYVSLGECVENPPIGAMGVHFIKWDLLNDSVLDITNPELLVYEPTEHGLRLVAAEWMIRTASLPPGTHPKLFGVPMKGPMPEHVPGMGEHFDLHAWVWKKNPSGTFEDWNPRVKCNENQE